MPTFGRLVAGYGCPAERCRTVEGWAIDDWPLVANLGVLAGAGLVLMAVGTRLTRLVDVLADRTGLGEAVAGALLLGATTSLPGLVTTISGALAGDAGFAVGNAVGGIAVQTVFIAVADLTYRRANLEHAAASTPNMLQAVVLIVLIGLVMSGVNGPEVTVLGVHPVSLLLPVVYLYGLRLSREARKDPMWLPQRTRETRVDVPEDHDVEQPLSRLLAAFAALALLVGGTGYAVAQAGLAVAAQTGLTGSVVGALLTGVVTSLPELVTVLAAVRTGALTLAVGDILGGNAFDVLFVVVGDGFFSGSIYHAVGDDTRFLLGLAIVLAGVLTAGLLHRARRGIGFEGVTILLIYLTGVGVLATG